ncbi:MAG: hypothetical protein ACXADL_07135 [Candidatus Thorarchaeota archaeon]|jgi:hypothetical protein
MKGHTKVIIIGVIFMLLMSGIIIGVVYADVEGPNIYQIDVLPASPQAGDNVTVEAYCIDASGISSSKLMRSLNGGDWQEGEMQFFECLCAAGGRWYASFGPLEEGDTAQFYVTSYDDSINMNPSDSDIFTIQITD